MNKRIWIWLIVSIFFALNIPFVLSATIFYDGFESGDLTAGNWTVTGGVNPWAVTTDTPYAGSYNAEGDNTDEETILEHANDTTGYSNINVTFWALTTGLDAGEYIAFDWYNGTDWINLMQIEDIASYTQYSYLLTSDADDNPNFKIRFRCLSSTRNEECHIDDVYIFGETGASYERETADSLLFSDLQTKITEFTRINSDSVSVIDLNKRNSVLDRKNVDSLSQLDENERIVSFPRAISNSFSSTDTESEILVFNRKVTESFIFTDLNKLSQILLRNFIESFTLIDTNEYVNISAGENYTRSFADSYSFADLNILSLVVLRKTIDSLILSDLNRVSQILSRELETGIILNDLNRLSQVLNREIKSSLILTELNKVSQSLNRAITEMFTSGDVIKRTGSFNRDSSDSLFYQGQATRTIALNRELEDSFILSGLNDLLQSLSRAITDSFSFWDKAESEGEKEEVVQSAPSEFYQYAGLGEMCNEYPCKPGLVCSTDYICEYPPLTGLYIRFASIVSEYALHLLIMLAIIIMIAQETWKLLVKKIAEEVRRQRKWRK